VAATGRWVVVVTVVVTRRSCQILRAPGCGCAREAVNEAPMRLLKRVRQPGGGTGWGAVRHDRTRGRRGRRACRLAGPRSDRWWRMPGVRRRGNRRRWRCAGGRPRVGAPRTFPGLAWCERTRRNPCCSTASSGMGEAREGDCAGDLHHGWFLPNRPDLTVFGMNRALGVTAVSVGAAPVG